LGGFESAKIINEFDNMAKCVTNSFEGSPLYMSPELLEGEKYNYQSDIFISYYLVFRCFPFQAISIKSLHHKNETGE